jgi:hypothetical protein
MKMINSGILTLLAIMALAMAAGCAASNGQPGAGAAGSGSAAGAPAEEQSNQASPYSQPLMATGGDLVMLHWKKGAIAA